MEGVTVVRRKSSALYWIGRWEQLPLSPIRASDPPLTVPDTAPLVDLVPRFLSILMCLTTSHHINSLTPLFPPLLISALHSILGRNEDDPAVPVTTGQAVRAAAAAAAREVEVEVEIPKPVSHKIDICFYCFLFACLSVILHLIFTHFHLQGRGDNDVPDFINKLRRRK